MLNVIVGFIVLLIGASLFSSDHIDVTGAILFNFFGLLIIWYPIILESEDYINKQNERRKDEWDVPGK